MIARLGKLGCVVTTAEQEQVQGNQRVAVETAFHGYVLVAVKGDLWFEAEIFTLKIL
jgi:hypothetical protein